MAYWEPYHGALISNDILSKQITLGVFGIPNVIEDIVTFTFPDAHSNASFEALTGYMPSNFTSFWTYNPATKALAAITNPTTIAEEPLPIIVSTPDQKFAMGAFSSDASTTHTNYAYWLVTGNTSKWDCDVQHIGSSTPGMHVFHCYVAIGSLADVEAAIDQLSAHFAAAPLPAFAAVSVAVPQENFVADISLAWSNMLISFGGLLISWGL
jgi:hypothetical protein